RNQQDVIGRQPRAGAVNEAASMPGKLQGINPILSHAPGPRVAERVSKYAMPQTHATISTDEIIIAATRRQRVLRTRLRGAFHFAIAITSAAGAATIVNGQMIRDASGSVSAIES